MSFIKKSHYYWNLIIARVLVENAFIIKQYQFIFITKTNYNWIFITVRILVEYKFMKTNWQYKNWKSILLKRLTIIKIWLYLRFW